MNKSFLLYLLFCLAFFAETSGQTPTAYHQQVKFGKVDPSEFNVKIKGIDSSAAAIKLFDIGKGYFKVSQVTGRFVYVFKRHLRYKINAKTAYELANMDVRLYKSDTGGEEKLTGMRAATYNLNGSAVEVSRMTSEAQFTNRLDKNHISKKYTLPQVKEGSILEYEYETVSDFIFKLDDWYFQGQYPSLYSSFTITIPEYYQYKISAGGYLDIKSDTPEHIHEGYIIPSSYGSSSGNVSALAQRTRYYAENIPAIKNESYITTLEDYISKIGFELAASNFPGSGIKDYSSTWPKVVSEMMKEEKFGLFMQKNIYEKGFLQGILKGETDTEAKTNLIFNYVKTHLKWDGKYNFWTTVNSHQAVLKKNSGNSADINLVLLGILQDAGIIAHPVLVSTRNNGRHPGYPIETKFNNVIVQVQIGDSTHLLDATNKHNVPDLLSYQNLNHKGLKVNLKAVSAEWIPIECNNLSRTSKTYSLKLGKDNKFSGTLFISSSNYEGVDRRESYEAAANEAEFLKTYRANKPGLEILDYKVSNLHHPAMPLEETMKITIEDNVEDAGNMGYFVSLLFDRIKTNPFSLDERNFPVDFAYPFEENCRIIVELPEDYKLEKLPKSESIVLPGKDGVFTITFVSEGNTIAIRSRINISKTVFTSEQYFSLKELFKNIVRKQSEQIVFRKS